MIGGVFDDEVGGRIGNVQTLYPVSASGALKVPPLALTACGGGSIDQVSPARAAEGRTLQSFWVTQSGVLVGYLAGAPVFVTPCPHRISRSTRPSW